MSADDWKRLLDILGLCLLGAAFILGILGWKIGNVISRRDAANLAKVEERTALAEKATEELKAQNLETESRLEQERIKRLELQAIVEPRAIRLTRAVIARLARETGASLHIEYLEANSESRDLADRIRDAARWAGWKASVSPSETAGVAAVIGRPRVGVEITSGPDFTLGRNTDLATLPRNRTAKELWDFLRANDIEATLYADVSLLPPGKPIFVRVWRKPLPYSKSTKLEGMGIISRDPSLPQKVREQHDADEKQRLEEHERLRKEWYPEDQ